MIGIYGPGEMTVDVLSHIGITPDCVFSTTGGGTFMGMPILPVTALPSYQLAQVIITSSHYPEILFGLVDQGFAVDKIRIVYFDGLDRVIEISVSEVLSLRTEYEERRVLYERLVRDYPGTDSPTRVERDNFRIESIRLSPNAGLNLEFGTYKGESIRTFSPFVDHIFGFDTFSGLPLDWTPGRKAGELNSGGLPEVPANCILVAGTFEETLDPFLVEHSGSIRFVFIDCDLYESTAHVLSRIESRLEPGSVVLFDELVPLPEDFGAGEHRAWTEFVANTNWEFRFDGRCGTAVRFVCVGTETT